MTTLLHPSPQALDTPLVSLRPWREDDAPALHEAVQESLDQVSRWLPWCHAGYDLAEALNWTTLCKQHWNDGEHYDFAILDGHGRLAGGMGLNELNERDLRANLGYWLRTSATGHGYASHAGRAVAMFGFEALGLRRIEIVAAVDNLASQRCAERIGAKREGIARQRIFLHGQSQDAVIYGLLPGDLA
ncbi:GNAT family N-acetyltransferase [Dyella caseinilytica]|uniref:GNAT family N-acetyltransferase n=1 Tax=Dyella caseinilytica TaxID=1849581 RepID=A0ABX7GNJ7_9GAMM|nr:GNAT family N-acetyltransferase [Dyella caseinilytica]QRN51947.1 GNAT family N-acetyltransferase [Dyella caseinilytica]GGA03833.1 N-acetyltransferase [Dyella caseinilytica]